MFAIRELRMRSELRMFLTHVSDRGMLGWSGDILKGDILAEKAAKGFQMNGNSLTKDEQARLDVIARKVADILWEEYPDRKGSLAWERAYHAALELVWQYNHGSVTLRDSDDSR